MKLCEELIENIRMVTTIEELQTFVKKLRKISYNNRNNEKVLDVINQAITKSNELDDVFSLVNLYSLKITHLQHQKHNLPIIININKHIRNLSEKRKYVDGLKLFYAHQWYIEKMRGDKIKASNSIEKCILLLNQSNSDDQFIYNVCSYLYAIEKWMENRDLSSVDILEKNFEYFYKEKMYHGLAVTLGVLVIIYQYSQNTRSSMYLIERILSRNYIENLIPEIQSIIHYFIGVSHKLSFNVEKAKIHIETSTNILKKCYNESIYSGYYLRGLAHLTACYALQGKLELANKWMIEVEKLIEEGVIARNLDTFSKKQIEHDFNLTKFYIHSRLKNFQIEQLQDLVQKILVDLNKQHSDAIFFSEFLLNANLSKNQLVEIKNLQNPSTKRVEHIINFLIEKSTSPEEKQIINLISALKRRPVAERMTLVERAFADLLAAQEYFKLERYAEIYPLLRRYEKQLNRIEVLELRIFMEAFIQIGAFKNGDPMGPALQYVAIRKCQLHGFSRLENRLLNYLDLQAKDVLNTMKYSN